MRPKRIVFNARSQCWWNIAAFRVAWAIHEDFVGFTTLLPKVENQMEKKMDNETEAGFRSG